MKSTEEMKTQDALSIVIQICIIPEACLGWGPCLNLLALLPMKCVGYCGNGRTCRSNRLEGYIGESSLSQCLCAGRPV